tara:strand:+ start:1714 stop:2481 length:768 start_codon:yes stop_codon:yes gene_type:complete
MNRLQLINYRGFVVTPDARDALVKLEERANETGKWKLVLLGPTVGTGVGNARSLAPAGREIHLTFRRSDRTQQDALNALWACAVPLGFTPSDRWPRESDTSHVFYFLGPWQSLNDRLLAEGRGHLAWPSVCAAAQVDVGAWKGDKGEERFVQAQLHRLGRNVGPVDGVVGPRTTAGVETLGMKQPSLGLVKEHVRTAKPAETVDQPTVGRGHLSLPGHKVRVQAFGAVKAQQNGESAAFLVADGQGRVVIEVERA